VPSRKLPVVCVDYCDAEAYCRVHGKRLCGRVGGSMNDPGEVVDPAADEWYAACAGAAESLYPYGNTASASQCNGSGYDPAHPGPRDLATLSACQGSLPGLYNMSGNVAEWEWACSSSSATATCATRGGSYLDGPYELRCAGSIDRSRMAASETVGFRCCANLKN
jgi:formylglycine-generating enzyme required for sulfatase activity